MNYFGVKFSLADLAALKRSMLVFSVLFVGGLSLSFFAFERQQTAKNNAFAAQSARNTLREKFVRLKRQIPEINEKVLTFEALAKRGILGAENRLSWFELLKELSNKETIHLNFEFSPQQKLDALSSKDVAFYSSRLSAKMMLLHEEVLFDFIDELKKQAPALIDSQSCELSQHPENLAAEFDTEETENTIPLRLVAECQIDWITMNFIATSPTQSVHEALQ